ncbi:hypothetical protein N752_13025 [Desulforamulus aquiferis]|nr:hypothetical protein N752_13025 [Desulforamulus aquiferis]
MNTGKIPLLTGREITTAISSGGLEIDIPGHISRMKRVIDFAKIRGGVGPGPRILLTGCPTTSRKVLNLIEESAIVVAMENCGGLKSIIEPVNEDNNPMLALAQKYLNIACPCLSPNHRRYELLSQLAIQYSVDGIIDLTWRSCHTYNIESQPLGKFIRDELGIPFLQIETDYSKSDIGWLKQRIDTFIDMIR